MQRTLPDEIGELIKVMHEALKISSKPVGTLPKPLHDWAGCFHRRHRKIFRRSVCPCDEKAQTLSVLGGLGAAGCVAISEAESSSLKRAVNFAPLSNPSLFYL